MPARVVVSFHGVVPLRAVGATHLARALAVKKSADALGATLCAWDAESFSFDFDPDELEEALSLAAMAAEEAIAPGDRFGIGVAQGALAPVGEASLGMVAWGAPLVTSAALARLARPGEVLLDPTLPAVLSGEILTTGPRLGGHAGGSVRGLRLDLIEPWRRDAALHVARLGEPPLVGCDGVFEELAVPLGSLGLVRADSGAGGSRLLAEWTDRLAPWRVLLITPVGAGREPLGAIRCALSRSAALYGAPPLPEPMREVLGRLLTGEGAPLWSVAELLDAWLGAAEARSGVLAVDDANDIDVASLDAVSTAITMRARFRMLARVDATAPLPEPFEAIPPGPALVIGPLARENAERLVAGFTGGAIAEDALVRWARRGGGTPLALREALAEGITSGELCWAGDVAVARKRSAGRGRTAGAHEWIARRVRRVAAAERALLTAMAILGGDAPNALVDELAATVHGPDANLASLVGALTDAGWVLQPEPGWTKLKSKTARDAFVGLLDPHVRRRWHEAAARTIERHAGVLGRAEAAWHAFQAGDASDAARLALEAAAGADDAGLDAVAAALVELARARDPDLVHASEQRAARHEPIPPPPTTSRSAVLAEAHPIDDDALELDSSVLEDDDGELGGEEAVFALDRRARRRSSEPADSNLLTKESPALGPSKLLELAKEALVAGDIATLDALVTELRLAGNQGDLIERMSGFVSLGRGAKTEALRKLQAATQCEAPPAKRARTLLAYGVALAAAGRTEDALLETLDALKNAREAGDRQGEHACSRFLARLSSASGHEGAAKVWLTTAEGTAAARAS